MRRILLATSALVALAGAGSAIAADSEGVLVTASVTASCTLTDPNDVSFGTDPVVGTILPSNFSYTCNFGGESDNLSVGFQSTNGGLKNLADTSVRSYTVNYDGAGEVTAASLLVLTSYPDNSATPNVAVPRTFNVKLAETLPVAGAYSDTITVSVTP